MTTEQRTIEFHSAFGHPVRDTPQTISREEAILALALIEEEYLELVDALFPTVREEMADDYSSATPVGWLQFEEEAHARAIENGRAEHRWYRDSRPRYEPNLIEVADALGDLDVVINGAGIRHGFDMQALSREVFSSNMSKLDEGGKPIYYPNGKIAKSELFKEPDIAGALGLVAA